MATVSSLPPQLQAVLDGLPRDLQEHIERVRVIARELAEGHRLDRDRVDLAAAAHDIARADSDDVLMVDALAQGVRITDADRAKPLLLHGPVGAGTAQASQLNVVDEAVVEAVYWHTTGLATMGPIAKAVFLADKFDLAKASRYPHIGRVRELAADDMDRAIVEFLRGDIVRLLNEGVPVHPGSQETVGRAVAGDGRARLAAVPTVVGALSPALRQAQGERRRG